MPRGRDPELVSQYACRFCGEQIKWGVLLRILRTDQGQPEWMGSESYAHSECLRQVLRAEVPLTLHRHWNGKHPMPDDSADTAGQPCAICGAAFSGDATHLRVQHGKGPVRAPEFDEQSILVHPACLGDIRTP